MGVKAMGGLEKGNDNISSNTAEIEGPGDDIIISSPTCTAQCI
jgi:hypothetical protein